MNMALPLLVALGMGCTTPTPDEEGRDSGVGLCASYEGLATAEEIALTPREDDQLEALAIQFDGTLVASDATYDRVVADVTAARSTYAELSGIETGFTGYGRSIVVYQAPEETLAAIADRTFGPTKCADALYVLQSTRRGLTGSVTLQFKGIYDQAALAREYARLTGAQVDPYGADGDGDHLCVRTEGEQWQYRFEEGWGDCPCGCIAQHWYYVVSDTPGEPVLVDDWGDGPSDTGTSAPDPDPRPDWMDAGWRCF